jgi:tripartite-type tricarboxylate transporter receptor subunit TctC
LIRVPVSQIIARNAAGALRRQALHLGGVFLATMGLACVLLSPATADESIKDFYSKKIVKFVIGSAGGGGYDFYSRLVGRFMSKHLPGNPVFVMQNMPGAAGVTVANYLYNVAPHDGSEFGMVARAVGTLTLLDPKAAGPRFTSTKFNWIGTPQQEVGLVLARSSAAVKTLDDLKTHELVVSGTSKGAPPSYYPRLMNALLGTKFKVIDGYKGSQDALLALERGEVEGHSSGSSAAPFRARIKDWLKDGTVRIIAQIAMEKDPEYPDVPLVLDLAKTPAERQILELVLLQQVMAWPIVAPPDVPAERVQALRDAFDATMKDPEFLAAAAQQQLGIDPVSGKAINAMLDKAYSAPDDVIARVRALSEAQ